MQMKLLLKELLGWWCGYNDKQGVFGVHWHNVSRSATPPLIFRKHCCRHGVQATVLYFHAITRGDSTIHRTKILENPLWKSAAQILLRMCPTTVLATTQKA